MLPTPHRNLAGAAALLLTIATTGGCAVQQGGQRADNAGVVCQRTTPTGSNLPTSRCTTAEERQREAEAAQAGTDALNRSGARVPATR